MRTLRRDPPQLSAALSRYRSLAAILPLKTASGFIPYLCSAQVTRPIRARGLNGPARFAREVLFQDLFLSFRAKRSEVEKSHLHPTPSFRTHNVRSGISGRRIFTLPRPRSLSTKAHMGHSSRLSPQRSVALAFAALRKFLFSHPAKSTDFAMVHSSRLCAVCLPRFLSHSLFLSFRAKRSEVEKSQSP
jgi:hypothetical protein